MSVFSLEELQKIDKNELITIIGNYINDQEILLNKADGLEKQLDDKKAEIERLKEELAEERIKDTDRFVSVLVLKQENIELQKQVDELKEYLNRAVVLLKEDSDLWFKYKFQVEV